MQYYKANDGRAASRKEGKRKVYEISTTCKRIIKISEKISMIIWDDTDKTRFILYLTIDDFIPSHTHRLIWRAPSLASLIQRRP
jgi:dTDP-4-dehydrorhamnose 3,5-epimerase-like enzyme